MTEAPLPRRIAAVGSLALGVMALAIIVVLAVVDFWRAMGGLGLLAFALALAWQGLRQRGPRRFAGLGSAVLLLAGAVALLITGHPVFVLALVGAVLLALTAGSVAFRPGVRLPPAPRPRRPVLLYNPRSGGGKAARFHLADEARARGIEPIELTPGSDLARLVGQALDQGADAVAMAGGDGSQAIVAAIAAARGVPYACIPAGTRNHFALDLGVDRDDVVGALEALVEGGERLVDLGEVNGRPFVNNVSLGLYGHAVHRQGYRDAKVRSLLETVPEVHGPGVKPELRWSEPDGRPHDGGGEVLVSNNPYRLGPALGSGTRPRLDQGVLGVTVLAAPGEELAVRTWTTLSFDIEASAPVPAGIDGEAVVLHPPLHFRIHPAVLRCRIACRHPGASPSAFAPERAWEAVRTLAGIAVGHDPRPIATAQPLPIKDKGGS